MFFVKYRGELRRILCPYFIPDMLDDFVHIEHNQPISHVDYDSPGDMRELLATIC